MKLVEAIKRVDNLIICEKCKVKATHQCNDECNVLYEVGTVGECIEALETLVYYVRKNMGSEQERWLRGE